MMPKIDPSMRTEIRVWSCILTNSLLFGTATGMFVNSGALLAPGLCLAICFFLVMANNSYVAQKRRKKEQEESA